MILPRRVGLVLVATLVVVAHAQTVLHVDQNADQTPHDGSSWCRAYVGLTEALAVAGPGTTIRVADGTYLPDETGLADPRAATFTLRNGVTVEGGYAGCGAVAPDGRDLAAYSTVLSGERGVSGSTADNCYHVVTGSSIDTLARLDGVTITAGNAIGSGTPNEGGGMLLYAGNLRLVDCTLRENAAQYGGGLFTQSGSPTLVRCTFEQNQATGSGGAMYTYGYAGQPSATLIDCEFRDNTAQSSGGALRNWDSAPVLNGCLFYANHTRYFGAAVANGGQSSAAFTRCTFQSNRTDTLYTGYNCYGGALHNTEDSSPVLVSCVFAGNAAYAMLPYLSYGGALANAGNARPTLRNCTLSGNYANHGHGMYDEGQSHPSVISSILWDGSSEIVNAAPATVSVTYSDVQGSWAGSGNSALDPLFQGLRLQAGSPCINTGDPAFAAAGETDLDGHARVLCGRVDMGAYEFGIGDFDCDRDVDGNDFPGFGTCMTGPVNGPYNSGCEALDFEFDTDVDLSDFAAFQTLVDG
jgi:predicted outer membrane repeat protein